MKLSDSYLFIFEELTKRDFKKKYKRSILGIFWSILSPLLMLCVMAFVFKHFFGKEIPHYTSYIFSGLIVFNYFSEATNEGMNALMGNKSIFTKINVPKYLFLLSKNVSSLINFLIILCIYFVFLYFDGIYFSFKFLCLLYPIACLVLMNLGIGLVLSALFVFFMDIKYLYRLVVRVILYGSAVFYSIDRLSPGMQNLFYCNPIYLCIAYFRSIVLYNAVPPIWMHGLMAADAFVILGLGLWIYKKYNYRFLYYV